MAMFARKPFLPGLQAAMAGQVPGAILEEQDPYLLAQILNAPVPASGDFQPSAESLSSQIGNLSPPTNYGGYGGLPPQPYYTGTERMPGLSPSPPGPRSDPSALPPLPSRPPVSALPLPTSALPPSGQQVPRPPQPMWADEPAPKKKKNRVGAFLGHTLGYVGDALAKNSNYADHLKHKRTMEENRAEAERKARLPQQVGQSIIVPDGQGGYKSLFRDPSAAEAWALARGFEPGTADYKEAVRQYALGTWKDDAAANRIRVSGYGYDRRGQLQDDRQEHSTELQEDRQKHSDSQLGRRLDVTRRGQNLTRENNSRSTRQSDTNNRRTTDTSRDNSIRSNETRLQTSRRGRSVAPVRVKSLEEARRLRPGTVFITPDGRTKVR